MKFGVNRCASMACYCCLESVDTGLDYSGESLHFWDMLLGLSQEWQMFGLSNQKLVALCPCRVFFWTGFCGLERCHALGNLSVRGLWPAHVKCLMLVPGGGSRNSWVSKLYG